MLSHAERRRIEARIHDLAVHIPSLKSLADAVSNLIHIENVHGFAEVRLRALPIEKHFINVHLLHLYVGESHQALSILKRDLHPLSSSQILALLSMRTTILQLQRVLESAMSWRILPSFLGGQHVIAQQREHLSRAVLQARVAVHGPLAAAFGAAGLTRDVSEFCKDFDDRKSARARGTYFSHGGKPPISKMARAIVGSEMECIADSMPLIIYGEDGASFCPLPHPVA